MTEDIDSLIEQIERLTYEKTTLENKLQEFSDAEAAARARIEKAYREAENKRATAENLYVAEVAALKSFEYKWRNFVERDDIPFVKKQEIIDLLTDFLNSVGVKTNKEIVKEVDGAILSGKDTAIPSDALFDLDKLLNPPEDLDLAELCKELGVYKGE